jgi:hypothetical protein
MLLFRVGVDVQHQNVVHLILFHIMPDSMCNLLNNFSAYPVCVSIFGFVLEFFVLFYSEMDWRRERSYGNDPCFLNLIDRYNEQDQNEQILSN